jgi:hypothetical protein
MCDYSLHHLSSRPARVSDKVVTTELSIASTRGFAAVGEHGAKLVIHDGPPKVAVCLLPGTELAFDDNVRYDRAFSLFGKAHVNHKVARFRQIDLDYPHVQHDALEFPDGQILKVARLATGQTATVLQLPVATQHREPPEIAHVVARSIDSRVALNRLPLRTGMASILVPNQGAVMLWQTLRSAVISLSTALVQWRHFKARKPDPILRAAPPAGVDANKIEASLQDGILTASLPKRPATPEKKVDEKAAA